MFVLLKIYSRFHLGTAFINLAFLNFASKKVSSIVKTAWEETRVDYSSIPAGLSMIVWIEGFCLGLFWRIGPQKTPYVSTPLLKQGNSEIVILEVKGCFNGRICGGG